MATDTNFKVLTSRSLKAILTEPTERIVPEPLEKFLAGNQLPRKYYDDESFVKTDMTCVPLEEIDPAYKNFQTFVVIGKFGTIHRYTARNALGSLSPLNGLRKWAIFLTTHRAMSIFMSAVVFLNIVLLVKGAGKIYDHAATVIYVLEFVLKIISQGLIQDPFTYFRKPWNWLDLVVISTSLIRPLKNVPILNWVRVLKLMQLTPEIRRSFKLVAQTVPKLGPVLLLSSFSIVILALIGKLEFMGIFTRRCVSYSEYWEQLSASFSYSNDTTQEVVSWRDFAQNQENWFSNQWCLEVNDKKLMECPDVDDIEYECVPGVGRNPDYGISNFDTIGWAGLQTVRIINQDYLEGILNQLTNASASPTTTIVYFIVVFFFGTYALGTLAYAIVGQHVFNFLKIKFKNSTPLSKDDTQDDGREEISRKSSQQPQNKDHVERFVQDVLQSAVFEVVISSTILLDTVALSLQHPNMSTFVNLCSKWMIRLAMVIYTLEFVLKIYSAGPRKYFVKGWNIFDFAVLIDMYLQIFYKKYFMSLPVRIFKLTPRWNTLNVTFKILVESVKTLLGFVGLLVVFGSFFALIGTSEFRQSYFSNRGLFEGNSIPLWSFADFLHSTMMVIRTWIGEFHEMLGECLLVQEHGCIIYFVTIALTGILILMTITVGIIFVTDRTLKSREKLKWEPSILAKMFCYPYVWLRTQSETNPQLSPSSSNYNSYPSPTFSLSPPPNNTKKIISCSPTPGGSTVLRGISSFIIIVFSLVLVLDNIPYEGNINVDSLVYAVDVVFTIFIAIMVGYNLVVLGIKYCVTSPGWIFDICVVLEMIINLLYDLKPDLNPYPTFYLFRSLRPFMLVSRIEILEIILRGFLRELRFLWKFIIVGAFISLHFSILGTKMFSGAFNQCQSNNSSAVMYNKDECLTMNHTWINSDLNSDHIGKSVVSLAYVGKRSSWNAIFYESSDVQPRQMFGLFVTLFEVGIFIMSSIIVGVLYHNLNKFEGYFLTKDNFIKAGTFKQIPKSTLVYSKPDSKYRGKIYSIISSGYFDAIVLLVIFLDAISLAWIDAELEFWSQELPFARNKIRNCISFLYLLELSLKLVGWGKSYFYNGWNQFDFFVVVACITEMVRMEFEFSPWNKTIDLFRILRLLRICQFTPLTSRAKTLCRYVTAFKKFSLIFRNLLIFQFLLMYSYALIGIRKFGHTKLTKGFDEYYSFQTVGSSFRVLFMLSSMSGIDQILPALTLTEENGCTPDKVDTISYYHGDCGSMIWGTIFVYSYIFFSFLTFTNLYMFFIFEILEQFKKADPAVACDKNKVQIVTNCTSNPSNTSMPSTFFEHQNVPI